MDNHQSRRTFIKLSAKAFPAIFIPRFKYSSAEYNTTVPLDEQSVRFYYWLHGIDHDRWGRRGIVEKAVDIFAARFARQSVLDNAYAMSERYCINSNYWNRCNMVYYSDSSYFDLLAYQIRVLRIAVPFPEVHIHSYYQRDNSWGKAEVGLVRVMNSRGIDVRGKFKIFLNNYHLGGNGNGSDSEIWAKIIAHEILHNLGHCHGKNSYPPNLQIVAFEDALYYNGNCWWNSYRPHFGCG